MPSDDDCVHHWVIEEPTGAPTVRGKCKKCPATREWRASLEIDDENAHWQTNKLRSIFTQYDPDRLNTRIL